MKQIHLVMPFMREQNKDILLDAYRPMNVILHLIMFEHETATISFDEPWVFPAIVPLDQEQGPEEMEVQNVKRNWFIENCEIIDDDYYVAVDDDDMYESNVFDEIKKMDDDIIIISMKRGHKIPSNVIPDRRYPTTTLMAHPDNVQVGFISNQQSFVKGHVFKKYLYDEHGHCADGRLAVRRKEEGIQTEYRPDLFALFNYYEPGRWDKPSRMKISNFKLAIGIPCDWIYVPLSFFHSFTLMEKPDYQLITTDNGHIADLRNDIVEKAQMIGATKLIMMDIDQIYDPKTITKLLAHNLPVVGAKVHRRYPPFDPIIMNLTDEGYKPVADYEPGSLVECDATGTGCIMYDIKIFKQLPYPWFKVKKDQDTGMVIGEDIGLCQGLRKLGYKIYVDTSIEIGHLSTMIINEKTHELYKTMKGSQQIKKEALGIIGGGHKKYNN